MKEKGRGKKTLTDVQRREVEVVRSSPPLQLEFKKKRISSVFFFYLYAGRGDALDDCPHFKIKIWPIQRGTVKRKSAH